MSDRPWKPQIALTRKVTPARDHTDHAPRTPYVPRTMQTVPWDSGSGAEWRPGGEDSWSVLPESDWPPESDR